MPISKKRLQVFKMYKKITEAKAMGRGLNGREEYLYICWSILM